MRRRVKLRKKSQKNDFLGFKFVRGHNVGTSKSASAVLVMAAKMCLPATVFTFYASR